MIDEYITLHLISAIQSDLEQQADTRTASIAQSYFKDQVTCHGVKTAIVNQLARKYFNEVKSLSKDKIFDLAESLLNSDYNEEAFIAFEWAYRLRARYEPADFYRLERWIEKYVNNWAKCDTLCNHAVGAFIEQFPDFMESLKQWAKADNRWLRRACAVSLIIPARKGMFLKDVFEIAEMLLGDQDDMVQKGYGWLLKEASKNHLQEVYDFVIRNRTVMSRTALRYSIEKMPEDLRKVAMEKPWLA